MNLVDAHRRLRQELFGFHDDDLAVELSEVFSANDPMHGKLLDDLAATVGTDLEDCAVEDYYNACLGMVRDYQRKRFISKIASIGSRA